jgi:hypothetical protein
MTNLSQDLLTSEASNKRRTELLDEKKSNPNDMSLETLSMLVHADRLHYLHNKIQSELGTLKQRQDKVAALHKIMKKLNVATTDTGELDCSKKDDIQKLLKDAKALGVEIEDGKHKYSKEERDRLIENFRMTIEDYNVSNDMQLQAVNRLTNERYESYQLIRAIMKPLHEDKMGKARAVKGG